MAAGMRILVIILLPTGPAPIFPSGTQIQQPANCSMTRIQRVAPFALAAGLLLSLPCLAADVTGQATVIDGDTIEIGGAQVRFYGIDAPELDQTCTAANGKVWRCGQEAARALAGFVSGQKLQCQSKGDPDRFGHMIAVCTIYFELEDIGGWLVMNGWALAYREYSDEYIDAEQIAKNGDNGMWRGMFIAPWDWRKGVR
jgi:endonuclease YncB( thermonuclease family)